ncbi:hypothetical protein L208DRAFT_1124433, partial [Tricholoma matsutake]
PQEFMHDGVMEAIAKFVACDNRVLVVADKVVFCNCLVAMRLKAGQQDIPSTHNVATYIHNE